MKMGINLCTKEQVVKTEKETDNKRRGDKMTSDNVRDHIENELEREEGHVDTRESNFQCESPDKNLGCDPGIDVAG